MARDTAPAAAASRRLIVLLAIGLAAVIAAYLIAKAEGSDNFGLFITAAGGLSIMIAVQLALTARALKAARSEVADEHARLERMFLDARIGMVLVDDQGRWVRVNPAVCAMLGYAQEELENSLFPELTHEHDLRDVNRTNQGKEFEKRYITRDRNEIWALVNVSPITEWQRGERFQVVQIQDITERKRAERAFAEERQLLKAFLESTPDLVYFKDLASRFIRVSDAQAARLGFERAEDAIGKSEFDALPREQAQSAVEDEQRVIRTGEPLVNVEERVTLADGREAWVSTSKIPLSDRQGDIIGTFAVSRDITTQKQAEHSLRESEERFRTLIAHSQEIVMLVDRDGRLVYVSPSVERWLGFHPDALVGSELSLTSHPEDEESLGHACEAVEPSKPIQLTHRLRHRDGSWHTLESTLVSLRDDPAIGAVVIAARDVTEHVALEQERERLDLERRVSHRLEAVGQLASGIAHEINTPLQFVGDSVTFLKDAVEELLMLTGLYSEFLHTEEPIAHQTRRDAAKRAEEHADLEYLYERIPAAFKRTLEGIDRVRSIVLAMKRFSHASAHETAPADLNEAIDTTLAVCRNEYKYVAEVVLDVGELPPVICNVGELNQVFLNLIVNASQAIEEERAGTGELGTITISTRLENAEAVIEIADDGPGIPPELQDRIYEPFFTTKEVGRGSGQGLALARTIIESHSGTLECASTPGEGTKFTIRLPLEPKQDELAEAA